MPDQPLVSVLMTAYNRERYVGDAIKSVLQSTYKNFELIVVDDCSTDGTCEVVRKYETRDSRIKLYVNPENLGDYPNRNMAASYAMGKYIKYLDSDDLIYPHGLEVFVASFELFPKAGLCVSSSRVQLNEPFPVCVPREAALRQHFFRSGMLDTGPSGVMILRDAFQDMGGFSDKRMVGDTEMWFRLSCRYDVVISQPSLIFWRRHEGQEFFAGVRSGLYDEMNFDLIQQIVSNAECTLTAYERETLIQRYRRITSRQLLKSLIRTRDFERFLRLKNKFGLRWVDYLTACWKGPVKLN